MLERYIRPGRRIRFGDTPKGAQLRKMAQELDRKAPSALRDLELLLKAADLFQKMGWTSQRLSGHVRDVKPEKIYKALWQLKGYLKGDIERSLEGLYEKLK